MVVFKITRPDIFTKTVQDVDTSDLSSMEYRQKPGTRFYSGTLTVHTKLMIPVNITGDHAAHDYESRFGFILDFVEPVV